MTCALHVQRYDKAAELGADIATLDLEDSVPAASKEEARRLALPFFARPASRAARCGPCASTACGLPTASGTSSPCSKAAPARTPSWCPRWSRPQDILILEELLGEQLASTVFLVLIETAAGLCAVEEIAAATPRVRALVFGGADFSTRRWGSAMAWEQLLYARSRILVAASRAGIPAMDSPYFEIGNEEALRSDNRRSQELGFQGKVAVHPRQVPVINQGYHPAAGGGGPRPPHRRARSRGAAARSPCWMAR